MAFIRRRTRGNTYYYELVKNARENGKVVQTVLKYFPSKKEAEEFARKEGIQFNIDKMGLIEPQLEARLIKKLSALEKMRPLSPSILESLHDKFEIEMTYNSNAIEGNRLTLRETWLVLRKGTTIGGKTVQEHLEATNHLQAIELLEKILDRNKDITELDVLELHAVILDKIDPKNAGFYRHERVFIQGSQVVLPKWGMVPELMKEVYSELNNKDKGLDAIISAVKVHYRTVRIHPFTDGNGRLARLLMNLRLMRSGFPPMVMRRQERRAYYSALEKADKDDLRPLSMLVAKDVERALDLYLEAAE